MLINHQTNVCIHFHNNMMIKYKSFALTLKWSCYKSCRSRPHSICESNRFKLLVRHISNSGRCLQTSWAPWWPLCSWHRWSGASGGHRWSGAPRGHRRSWAPRCSGEVRHPCGVPHHGALGLQLARLEAELLVIIPFHFVQAGGGALVLHGLHLVQLAGVHVGLTTDDLLWTTRSAVVFLSGQEGRETKCQEYETRLHLAQDLRAILMMLLSKQEDLIKICVTCHYQNLRSHRCIRWWVKWCLNLCMLKICSNHENIAIKLIKSDIRIIDFYCCRNQHHQF